MRPKERYWMVGREGLDDAAPAWLRMSLDPLRISVVGVLHLVS